MDSAGVCENCRAAEAANAIPRDVRPIGEPVRRRVAIGRGHDQTEHFFSQCAKCGSVWVSYVDSGAGGHGRFHRRLTRDLF